MSRPSTLVRLVSSTALLGFVVVVLSVPLGALLYPESWASLYETIVDTISGDRPVDAPRVGENAPAPIAAPPAVERAEGRDASIPSTITASPDPSPIPEPADEGASMTPTSSSTASAPEPSASEAPAGDDAPVFERWIEEALIEDPSIEDRAPIETGPSATSQALSEGEEQRVKETYRSALDALQRSRSRR